MYEKHRERRSDALKREDLGGEGGGGGHAFPFEHLSRMIVIEVLRHELEY